MKFHLTQADGSFRASLSKAKNILLHCLGCPGITAVRLPLEPWVPAQKAILQVGKSWPGTIETAAQTSCIDTDAPAGPNPPWWAFARHDGRVGVNMGWYQTIYVRQIRLSADADSAMLRDNRPVVPKQATRDFMAAHRPAPRARN